MTLMDATNDDSKLEKYIPKLKDPAKKTKHVLQDKLEKSIQRFQEIVNSASEKQKSLIQRKKEKIARDLDLLKILSEEEIIRYALSRLNNIIPIASNPRISRQERMKARVAAHKPLSSHLTRLKQKLSDSQDTSSNSEDEHTISSSSLNKITFNNTVVLMRKDVRRAKVHIIHKLTRTIQKLRAAKGIEEKVAKLKRKAERLHKKVIHIKELQEDDVSRYALSTTDNLSQLATDIKASTTSQAMATIAIHEFVAAHVREFKTKYPDWQKVVPNLLKKKKNKKLKLKLEDAGNRKMSEVTQLPQENEVMKTDHSKSGNHSGSENDFSENESDSSENESNSSENKEEYSVNENSASGTEMENDNSENEDEKVLESSLEYSKKKNSKETKIPPDGSSSAAKKSANKTLNKTKKLIREKTSSPTPIKAKLFENKPKVIDPFFVTTTNEEYVTSQVPLTSEENSSSRKSDNFKEYKPRNKIELEYKNKRERKFDDGKFRKPNRFQESHIPHQKASGPHLSAHGFNKNGGTNRTDRLVFGNRKERRKASIHSQVEEKVEKLHPSWEAKKRQTTTIIPFQGKKVKFD